MDGLEGEDVGVGGTLGFAVLGKGLASEGIDEGEDGGV